MPGKHFTQFVRPASTPRGWWLLLGLLGAAAGCRNPKALTRPAASVDTSIRPEHFSKSLRQLGRAHFRCVAKFEAAPDGSPLENVTTETDLWMDDLGNWRLVELNNKDGGREVVRHGKELDVALRYGKMIRRAAEDPEPEHLLEEGLGAPFAAWELLRGVSTVDDFGTEIRAGRKVHVFKLTKAKKPRNLSGDDLDERTSWRRTLVAGTVEGSAVIDDLSRIPLLVDIRSKYTMRRGGQDQGTPMQGAVDVHATVEDIGRSPRITKPEAEDMPVRQRTIPEEKALLGGLPPAGRAAQATP